MGKALLIVLCVVLVIAVCPLLVAGLTPWRLASNSEPVSLGHGATYVTKGVQGAVEAELHLVFFDARTCDLHVVEEPLKKGARSLEKVAIATAAIAACNGL